MRRRRTDVGGGGGGCDLGRFAGHKMGKLLEGDGGGGERVCDAARGAAGRTRSCKWQHFLLRVRPPPQRILKHPAASGDGVCNVAWAVAVLGGRRAPCGWPGGR